jgi:hypothetical protein
LQIENSTAGNVNAAGGPHNLTVRAARSVRSDRHCRAASSAGRAPGLHPGGAGFESSAVHGKINGM